MLDYSARTDTDLQKLTWPASIPRVNAPLSDPDFPPTYLVRITDGDTMAQYPAYAGRSFRTDGSAEAQIWSADGTILVVKMEGNMWLPFAFDPSTMHSGRILVHGSSVGQLPWVTIAFDAVHPNLVYGVQGHTLQAYDFITRTSSTLFDLARIDTNPPWLGTGAYVADLSVSADGSVFSLTAGGPRQDDAPFVLVVCPPDAWRWYNCQTGEIGGNCGVSGPSQPYSTLHNSRLSKSGAYVEATPTRLTPPQHVVWEVRNNRTDAASQGQPDLAQGHRAMGYNWRLNPTGTKDQMYLAVRHLADLHEYVKFPEPPPTPQEWPWDKHWSWNNAGPLDVEPVFGTLYNANAQDTPTRCWDGEIIGVSVDGSERIYRFAHHRSSYDPKDFWSTPRGNVSPDGKWYAWTSNWGKQLGGSGPWRQDVFVCALTPFVTGLEQYGPENLPDVDESRRGQEDTEDEGA